MSNNRISWSDVIPAYTFISNSGEVTNTYAANNMGYYRGATVYNPSGPITLNTTSLTLESFYNTSPFEAHICAVTNNISFANGSSGSSGNSGSGNTGGGHGAGGDGEGDG